MQRLSLVALLFVIITGCAHGKIGQVDQALATGAIDKATPITVEAVTTKNTKFSGDKSADVTRTNQEKEVIEDVYAKQIAEALRKRGYNAKTGTAASGIVISGDVSRFDHGSAAARMFGGYGAGSSNMYTDFKIEDRTKKATLAKFEVIATSGGRSGFAAAGSFMEAHLLDGATKVADYIEKGK